jgi:hypothetical protein
MQSPRICNPLAQRAYESDAKSPSGTCFYRTYGRRRDRHLRSLKLLACGGLLAFACASRADLPSAPDGKAWVPIPDRSSELMAYAASELRKTARAHGMKCGGVVSATLRCEINFGFGGSFVAWAADDRYDILVYFGQRESDDRVQGNAALFAMLHDYGGRLRKRKRIGELGTCRAAWVVDWRGSPVCTGSEL